MELWISNWIKKKNKSTAERGSLFPGVLVSPWEYGFIRKKHAEVGNQGYAPG